MSMLQWSKRDGAPNLILFIHGLKGGSDTWSYSNTVSFPKLLSSDPDFEHYDIACFEYFTNFTNFYGKTKNLLRRLFQCTRKKEINLPVSELSELLVTEMDVNLSDYKNVIFVAHSMGGLVAKSCILKMIKYGRANNLAGFISLAVPHSGAGLASVMSAMITSNVQIKDLSVFSNETDALNREWLTIDSLPKSKFVYGTNDTIVAKQSALPIQVLAKDSVAVHEDHITICKPDSIENNVYKVVKKFVLEISNTVNEIICPTEFKDDKQYDNEYFVLKMIIADVHEDITNHAKEYYYNAELARNLFTSDHDRAILDNLYRKIKNLYQTQYQIAISERLSS
ncbi:hypothetical protein EVL08_21095, partial [Salmonella enterica]|nr:hypothetical protein [Salmonella enterica]